MKLPDFRDYGEARVLEYHGHADAVEAAACQAKLRYLNVDLSHADDKSTLFAALSRGLVLPEYFGSNFDALADSLEDRDWFGKCGCAVRLGHSAHYRRTHPNDWRTLEEILSEAATFWRERHVPFWVLVG